MDNAQIEQMVQDKGLTAPRVSTQDLEDNIVDIEIVKHVTVSGQVLRWAVLTTRSGFAVVGKHSASVSAANDNAEIGESVALMNSKHKMWELMGYELKARLFRERQAERDL